VIQAASGRWKRWVLIAALLAPLTAEAVLRLYGFGRAIRYQPDTRLGWVMEPNQRAFNVRGRAPVRINALGWRGPEVQTPKPPGTLRILYFGDGTTLNNQTREAEIWPVRVAAELASRSGHPVESVIAAVAGYQTEQALEIMRASAQSLAPDRVVIGFCWNDWAPTTMRTPGIGPQAYGENAGEGGVWRRVALRDFCIRLQTLLQRRAHFQRLARGEGLPATTQDDAVWSHVHATLDSIATRTLDLQATCTLVLLPAPVTAHDAPAYTARTERLRAWAVSRGVVFVDPAPQFAAAQARGLEPFLDQLHLGPAGQPLVAEAVLSTWEAGAP
jgi:lysophospholipase L1-like esterase